MIKLLDDADLLSFLGEKDNTNLAVLRSIRASVEALLEKRTGQLFGPGGDYVELHDGTGTKTMYVDRPIKSVTAIRFIYGPEIQSDVEISVTDDITYRVGSRRIYTRSYHFPDCDGNGQKMRDNVEVTYVALANQPEEAKEAVREAVTIIYRRRGSEEARSEQIGTYEHVLLRDMERESMTWRMAVEALHIPRLG